MNSGALKGYPEKPVPTSVLLTNANGNLKFDNSAVRIISYITQTIKWGG